MPFLGSLPPALNCVTSLEDGAFPHCHRLGLARIAGFALFGLLVLPIVAAAALDIAVEAGPDPARPGEPLRVAITVTNPGGSTSGAVTLQMLYPPSLSSLGESLVSDGGGCPNSTCDTNETVFWSLGTLGPGQGITVDLPPSVLGGGASPPDGTVITFAAEAFEGGGLAASAQHAVTVQGQRVFDLNVDDSRDPVPAGGVLVYEITYGNRSDETTTDTELSFPIPGGTSFGSASDGGTFVGGVVTWDLGTVPGHEGGRRTVQVTANAGLGEGVILKPNNASITGEGDFLTHVTRATTVARVENDSRVRVGIVVNPDPPVPGESVRAAITLTNPSTTSFVNNVIVSLRYPEGLASLSESLVSDGGGCPNSTCDRGEQLFWVVGSLAPGRGTTLTLPPSVAAVPGGSLVTLLVNVDADGQTRSLKRETVIVRDVRALDLAVEATRDPVPADSNLEYTVTFGNRTTDALTSSSLSVPVPGGTTFVSASDGGSHSNGVVTWNLGTLVGREGGQRRFTVNMPNSLAEARLLRVDPATIRGQAPFVAVESRARSLGRVENDTRLDVAIAVDRDPVVPGESLGVRVTVSNRSAIDFANNVVLRLRYPEGLSSLGETRVSDGGGCPNSTCDPAEDVFWNLGNLPPGGGTVVELPPAVAAGAVVGSVITLPVTLDATDRSRTRAAHPVLVRAARIYDLAVDFDADPVSVQGTTVVDVTYGNRSGESTTSTSLRLPIPIGSAFLGASNGGSVNGGAVVWNLGTVSTGETGRRRAAFSAPAPLTEGSLLRTFDARIRGNGPSMRESRSRDARRVEDVGLRLVVDAAPEPVSPGAQLDTTLAVTNSAGSTAFGVALQLRYSPALFNLSESMVSDGGGCPNSTCDGGEMVTWTLGDLNPSAMVDVSLPPTVRDTTPPGSLVRYWAHAFGTSFGKTVHTRSIAVGNNFDPAGPIDFTLFQDGFESGDLSAWDLVVP